VCTWRSGEDYFAFPFECFVDFCCEVLFNCLILINFWIWFWSNTSAIVIYHPRIVQVLMKNILLVVMDVVSLVLNWITKLLNVLKLAEGAVSVLKVLNLLIPCFWIMVVVNNTLIVNIIGITVEYFLRIGKLSIFLLLMLILLIVYLKFHLNLSNIYNNRKFEK